MNRPRWFDFLRRRAVTNDSMNVGIHLAHGRQPPAPPNKSLWYVAGGLMVLLALAAWGNRHLLNPDAVAYLRLAGYYAEGDWHLAVSGYWGPLLIWLMAPALKIGLAPLVTARLVMAVSALIFWWGGVTVAKQLRLPPGLLLPCAMLIAAVAVPWSVETITPDLLVAGLMCAAVSQMLADDWTERSWRQALSGLVWGLAYLAKAVALPLAFLVAVGFAAVRWMGKERKQATLIRATAVSLGVFLIVASPWILILSLKYHWPTFSTTARIAHAMTGPGATEHPTLTRFHTPEPGRITSWEDPTAQPYIYWSPFQSKSMALHQARVFYRNARYIRSSILGFDLLGLGFVALAGCLVCVSGWKTCLSQERWRLSAIPVLCLIAIYLPTYAEAERYY